MATYKVGSRGETVKQIQRALNLYPDGIFGPITRERVMQWQAGHGLAADGIVGPATLARLLPAVAASLFGLRRSKRRITEIIVHCTATREGKDYTVEDIRRFHKVNGWSDIGYHYVVYRDGTVHEGRNVDIIGAHCSGHNTNSIGVAYVGGVASDGRTAKDTRTDGQKASLLSLLMDLRRLYPAAAIRGHRDFANKECPSFDATREYGRI